MTMASCALFQCAWLSLVERLHGFTALRHPNPIHGDAMNRGAEACYGFALTAPFNKGLGIKSPNIDK